MQNAGNLWAPRLAPAALTHPKIMLEDLSVELDCHGDPDQQRNETCVFPYSQSHAWLVIIVSFSSLSSIQL